MVRDMGTIEVYTIIVLLRILSLHLMFELHYRKMRKVHKIMIVRLSCAEGS